MLERVKKSDLYFIIFPIILAIFGLSTVFSLGTTNVVFIKQFTLHILGIILCFLFLFIDFRFLKSGHYIFLFYLFSVFLLGLLVILGTTINGAQSWFSIFGVSLQPVEIAKFAIILVLAKFFYKRHMEISYLPTIIVSFFYAAPVFFLTLMQPDLGSGLVVLAIWFFVVLVSGIPFRYIALLGGFASLVLLFSWFFLLQPYQKERVFNFVDPKRDIRGSGYNVYQSMIAVGSGGVWGKGISQGSQSKLSYLPEYETDFIFAAFAEEWGLVGSLICLLAFSGLILNILRSTRYAESNFEILVAVGFSGYLITHSVVNIGMNIGLLPVTGIPLPFMSAGGTHVLVEWIILAVIISLSVNGNKNRGHTLNSDFNLH